MRFGRYRELQRTCTITLVSIIISKLESLRKPKSTGLKDRVAAPLSQNKLYHVLLGMALSVRAYLVHELGLSGMPEMLGIAFLELTSDTVSMQIVANESQLT